MASHVFFAARTSLFPFQCRGLSAFFCRFLAYFSRRMKKKAPRLTEPEHGSRIGAAVRRWQKQKISKRMNVAKLAEKLNISRKQLSTALKAPRKRLRRAEERVRLKNAVRERAKKSMKRQVRRDTATKILRELGLKTVSQRVAQMVRKPFRDKIAAWKQAEKRKRKREAHEYSRRISLPVGDSQRIEETVPYSWRLSQ